MNEIVETPRNEDIISFNDKSKGEFVIELSDKKGRKADTLLMSRVSRNLMILKSIRRAKGRVRQTAVSNSVKKVRIAKNTTAQRFTNRHGGKVNCFKDNEKTILLGKSGVLGYVGILTSYKNSINKGFNFANIVSNLEKNYVRYIRVQGLAYKHLMEDNIKKCAELKRQLDKANLKSSEDELKLQYLTTKLTEVQGELDMLCKTMPQPVNSL
jgi:hypothetical protein